MKRKLNKRIETETEVFAVDEKGVGNANHEYRIRSIDSVSNLAEICFQKGAIQEHEVNGIQIEDLLVICIDRLEGFQSGEFQCLENATALINIETALLWLNRRTFDRRERGVEGISKK